MTLAESAAGLKEGISVDARNNTSVRRMGRVARADRFRNDVRGAGMTRLFGGKRRKLF
jgi:hypothetical protein